MPWICLTSRRRCGELSAPLIRSFRQPWSREGSVEYIFRAPGLIGTAGSGQRQISLDSEKDLVTATEVEHLRSGTWICLLSVSHISSHLLISSHITTMLSTVRFSTATILYCLVSLGWSATVTYDFNITWVTSNPDGAYERSTIGINGQWPLPAIRATVGDQVVVNVMNQLGNETTSLHFHGIYQTDSPEMDGTAGVSQCAIPPGASLTYNFLVRSCLSTCSTGED